MSQAIQFTKMTLYKLAFCSRVHFIYPQTDWAPENGPFFRDWHFWACPLPKKIPLIDILQDIAELGIVIIIIVLIIGIIVNMKAFLEYDVDGSGNISIAELGGVMKKLGENPTEDELQVLSSLCSSSLNLFRTWSISLTRTAMVWSSSPSSSAWWPPRCRKIRSVSSSPPTASASSLTSKKELQ